MRTQRAAHGLARLLVVAVSALLMAPGVGSAATTADWTGTWSFVDTCTSGRSGCPGVYTWSGTFVQTGGSVTGTGTYTVDDGAASGATLTFTAKGSRGYEAYFRMTMSADGTSAAGTATDNDGRKFTIKATGNGKPATPDGTHIKGRVVDSFKEGVDNVRVLANGKGGSKQSITSNGGYFDIKLSDIKKAATYNVSASNKLYRFIDPRIRTVTVKPGGTGYAAFSVATGKLRGTVRELDCRRTSPLAPPSDCRARKIPAGAVVEIRGDQVGRKYAPIGVDGTYEFKVPVGSYDVRVNRLDTSAARGADVCKEDRRIPARGGDEVGCDKVVDVVARKGAVKTTDFVAVPRIMVAELRLLAFDRRNRPRETASVQTGLSDPRDPELFGDYGSGSGKTDYPVVLCKSGCATVEATARNLFGKPVRRARFIDLRASPIEPGLGVTPGNEGGVACFTPRNVPGRARRDCLLEERVDADGRALGIYAAPGIVPGGITQQPDGQPRTVVTAVATARGYSDAPVSAGPLVITQNERVGTRRTSQLVLTQKEADELNLITDPNTAKQGFVNTVRGIPEACEDITAYFLGKEGTGGKVGKARDGISKLCDAFDVPSKLAKPALEQYVDLVGAMFLARRLGIRADGLISSFGNRFDVEDIPTSPSEWLNVFIPNTLTPAGRFLSDYLKDWRKAQGPDRFDADGNLVREPIKAGQRVILRLFEVSHYERDPLRGGDLVRAPAVLISVQADFLPEPKTLIVTGKQGYDPLVWLG